MSDPSQGLEDIRIDRDSSSSRKARDTLYGISGGAGRKLNDDNDGNRLNGIQADLAPKRPPSPFNRDGGSNASNGRRGSNSSKK